MKPTVHFDTETTPADVFFDRFGRDDVVASAACVAKDEGVEQEASSGEQGTGGNQEPSDDTRPPQA